jgi:OOP family OmpA-OmpF porin
MKILNFLLPLLLVGCASTPIINMADQVTAQKYDLSDLDGDGVIESREKCSTSMEGSHVDNNGCGAEISNKVRQELRVNFANNSAVIEPRYYTDIKALADFMERYPDSEVVIEGHTSKQGSSKLNMALSQRRAQAVMDLLVNNYDIATFRVSAVGYGFDRLLDEGTDKEAHAHNRRIVAELSSENQTTDMKWNIYSVDKSYEY